VSLYGRLVLPLLTDIVCRMKVVKISRSRVVPRVWGRVLEIGVGTGLNGPYYDPERVGEVVGIDPDETMIRMADSRFNGLSFKFRLKQAAVESLPFDSESFDSVLVTFSFCSVTNPDLGMGEIRRVLKGGGSLFFAEHSVAPDMSVRKWQERITPVWRRFAGGCHLNRDFPALLVRNGFVCPILRADYAGMPKWLTYGVEGEARIPSTDGKA